MNRSAKRYFRRRALRMNEPLKSRLEDALLYLMLMQESKWKAGVNPIDCEDVKRILTLPKPMAEKITRTIPELAETLLGAADALLQLTKEKAKCESMTPNNL